MLASLIDLNHIVRHRDERIDSDDQVALHGCDVTRDDGSDHPALFSSVDITAPLRIAATRPLVESDLNALDDEPDVGDFQDESSMRQWLREYQRKKIYVRPVVVYPNAAVRALHEIFNRDDDKAVFDFIRFRSANLTANLGDRAWIQRQVDVANWTRKAQMLYRVIQHDCSAKTQRDVRVILALMQQQGFTFTDTDAWHCLWCGEGVRLRLKQYRAMVKGQRINRFPGSHMLTSPMLWATFSTNLKKLHELHIPAAFRLPEQIKQVQEYRESNRTHWIMIKKFLSATSPRAYERLVVQPIAEIPSIKDVGLAVATHFIDKTKLIMKRQAEINFEVAVTCFDPLRCYIYEEGIVYLSDPIHWSPTEVDYGFARCSDTAKKVWGIDDDDDVAPVEDSTGKIHRSWSWLKSLLRSKGYNADALQGEMRIQIMRIIISLQPHVIKLMRCSVYRRDACYEIFQFKYLLDRELRPWLIAVKSPDLKCISPVQIDVISGAIADTLNMIHIKPQGPIIIPKKKTKHQRPKGLGTSSRRILPAIEHHVDPLQQEMESAIYNECVIEDERKGRFFRMYPCPEFKNFNQVFADSDNDLQQAIARKIYKQK